MMFKYELKNLIGWSLVIFTSLMLGCGGPGEPSSEFENGNVGVIRGSIVSPTGSQSDMFGFIMVMMERDTGISRVAPVNSGGIFEFTNVKAGAAQTLFLLNSSYQLQSVLSFTGILDQTIRQYFIPQTSFLPRLIRDSEVIFFDNESKLSITSDTAADANNNGIPTGMDPEEQGGLNLSGGLNLANGLRLVADGPDTDGDRIPNEFDFDLDGDGLINWMDIDMDNNAPIDIFDADADDDIYLDSKDDETLKNEYNEGVEYFAVTVEQGPNESNVIETRLIVKTKTRDAVQQVWLDAPNSLLSGARYDARRIDPTATDTETDTETDTDTDTDTSTSAEDGVGFVSYDKKLRDDGFSEDDAANDGIWGEGVILKSGNKPLAYQTIFLKLDYGGNYFKWYPYMFPSVSLGSFTITYDANGFRFQKPSSSRPFGSAFTSYEWLVKVYNSDDQVVWESGKEDASTDTITDKLQALEQQIELANSGDRDQGIEPTTLRAVGFALSLQKVPGIPAYAVRSRPVILNP